MVNILFVCLGNICRSPLAEAIFNQKVEERNLQDQLMADSAGTSNYHIDELPDERTYEIAQEHNLTLDHRGRQIDFSDFEKFDYILAMDRNNLEDILAFRNHAEVKNQPEIFLMRKFEDNGADLDVPDPYFGGQQGFENVYRILDRTVDNFIDYLVEKHQLNQDL